MWRRNPPTHDAAAQPPSEMKATGLSWRRQWVPTNPCRRDEYRAHVAEYGAGSNLASEQCRSKPDGTHKVKARVGWVELFAKPIAPRDRGFASLYPPYKRSLVRAVSPAGACDRARRRRDPVAGDDDLICCRRGRSVNTVR
jgi:hypothetical protein